MLALVGSHALDDGFDALEGIVVDVHVLQRLAHAGNHAGQVLEVTHLLDLLNLVVEVGEVKLVLANLGLQFLGLSLVELFLGAFHERNDIAHAQNTVGHTCRVEGVYGLHLLARTHKLDGLVHHGADGQGCTATGVTVQLGEDNTGIVEALVELLGGVHGILTGHGIHHEEDFVRIDGVLDVGNLLHQFLVDGKTAGGIHDDNIMSLGPCLADGIQGYLNGVSGTLLDVHGHANLLAEHAQLLHGGGTEGVARGQKGTLVLLLLEHLGQFAAHGGLTGTVQTGHQNDAGLADTAGQVEFGGFATHQFCQFIVNDLHHQLLGLHGGEHVLSQSLLLHGVGEGLGHLVVHVGIQQGATHVLEGLGNIDFGNLALTLQYFPRAFETLRKIFKHNLISVFVYSLYICSVFLDQMQHVARLIGTRCEAHRFTLRSLTLQGSYPQKFLYQRYDYLAKHHSVQIVFALKEGHLPSAVVLAEVGLAVDVLVLGTEETPNELLLLGGDALETLFLHLLELCYHLLVHLEVACAVLALVAELLAAHATEGEQACHVEGGIHQNASDTVQLLGIHGAHGGGYDKVGLVLANILAKVLYGTKRFYRDIRTEHLYPLGIEVIAQLGGTARATCRSKTVYV